MTNEKIRVAFIYKRNYVFLTGNHFDNTTYYFFMNALQRNKELDVTYFPSDNKFDASQLKDKFDIILLPNNNTDGTPDELTGIRNLKTPVISRTGDPHYAKKYNQFQFHEKYKIDYYFNLQPTSYFYQFYPKHFKFKQILFGLEPSLYQHVKPFKDRIKNRILNSGNVGRPTLKSKIANMILHRKTSAWHFYKLRTKCNYLPYVDHTGMKGNKYINEDYPSYLSQYRASIAAGTYFPVIKYFEIPAAGCLTFMEVTKKNDAARLGYQDNKTAVFINVDNYKDRFEEFLNDPDNEKWENIANAGKKYTLEEVNNDRGVDELVRLMKQLLG